MKLGTILLWGDDLSRFRHQLGLAEELGYDVVGVGDSPAAWNEMYVSLTVAALASSTAVLTPMVTTPALRHPSVTAGAMSALHKLTGGRVVLTIGSGGSAVGSIGRKPATQQEMREYVESVRSLLAGGSAEFGGHTAAALQQARPVPIYISADGPKSLRLAGELADGVVIGLGMSVDVVDEKIATARDGAVAAGRDPDALDVWGLAFASVRDDAEQAKRDITPLLASVGGMGLKTPHMRALIPADLRDAVSRLEAQYDPRQHVVVGGSGARLVEELGLVDFLVGLRGLTGTPDQVRRYAEQVEKLGVTCLLAALPGSPDPDGTLRRMAQALR
ncbi:LLM class flavin-dependent oxidoreductase [Mycobacterium avium]|uniref:LLM class flavin-dependent oxidoreductase n=1 Tax=Mycobacterium avium TaxID=1764 RepID=UPI001CC6EC39|nr:LLM class flavin-dependent oxidoreductase [Mycobacterium avium]MBZ4521853.1 LLM class flavin-dependent oxidoreductase [Mycobacterium avium subsp. hominissuis]MBZ4531236.1 LLM class flavin-dependent oxidoreductase [Mycobacterium avium subsp. hominissuis]